MREGHREGCGWCEHSGGSVCENRLGVAPIKPGERRYRINEAPDIPERGWNRGYADSSHMYSDVHVVFFCDKPDKRLRRRRRAGRFQKGERT